MGIKTSKLYKYLQTKNYICTTSLSKCENLNYWYDGVGAPSYGPADNYLYPNTVAVIECEVGHYVSEIHVFYNLWVFNIGIVSNGQEEVKWLRNQEDLLKDHPITNNVNHLDIVKPEDFNNLNYFSQISYTKNLGGSIADFCKKTTRSSILDFPTESKLTGIRARLGPGDNIVNLRFKLDKPEDLS